MVERTDTESADECIFSQEDVDIIQSTWTSFMKDGTAEIGLVLLYRFFTEVPEVKSLFYKTEIDGLPENFTKDDLRERKKFMKHAERLGSTLNVLIKNMQVEEKFIKKCFSIGLAHKKHRVELRYFDFVK